MKKKQIMELFKDSRGIDKFESILEDGVDYIVDHPSAPPFADLVVYRDMRCTSQSEYDDFVDDLKVELKKKYSSLEECSKYVDIGYPAILANELVYFGVSRSKEVASIWCYRESDYRLNNLITGWIKKIKKNFEEKFSNLEVVLWSVKGTYVFKKKDKRRSK